MFFQVDDLNIKEQFAIPKKWGSLRPRFILSLVGILTFIALIIGYIEISQGHKEVLGLMQNEAETLAEVLSISAENAVLAYAEVEKYLEKNLYNLALLLDHLQDDKVLSKSSFQILMRKKDAARAFYVNKRGEIQDFVYPDSARDTFQPDNVTQFISPLFTEGLSRRSGYIEDCNGQPHFAIAFKRDEASAWIICSNPAELTEMRKRIGVGSLIQDIGENDEIVFIVIQDKRGILSATKNIEDITSLNYDPFLLEAFSNELTESRISTYGGIEIFEVVKPLYRSDQMIGLIRIAMSMNTASQAMTRTSHRALAVFFGFIVIAVILFNFFVSNQNYSLLTDAFSKFRTYTGNILENMADAVVVIDTAGRITLLNHAAEKLFNLSAKKAIGSHCYDIIGEQTSLLNETLISGEEIRDIEVQYVLDSKKVVLSATTRLIRNKDGEIDSVVAVLKDLTEKKMYENRLQQNEKLTAMGELASGVAHEIRNPLNAISIIAQRFLHEFKAISNQVEFKELATSVITATRQVSQIIQRFLEFARPDSINLKICKLNDIVNMAVMLIESQAIEKNISLDYNSDEIIDLNVDDDQVQQVLVNIIQNAIQATPAAGRIEIYLSRHDGEAVVKISDSGSGISEEHLKKIFDLYYTTKTNGSGMGLSISHRIVSQHDGRIEVESKVGRGTIFSVILPINKVRE